MKGVPSWDLEPFKLIQKRIQDTARKMIYLKNAPTITTTEATPKVEEATAMASSTTTTTASSSSSPPGGNPITLGSSIPTSSPMRS